MGWFKLVLVIPAVASLAWLAMFCDSWHKYREHVERLSELREEARRRAEGNGYWVKFGLEQSYWEWNHGDVMYGSGFALLLAWTLTATARRQVNKSDNLLPRALSGETALPALVAAGLVSFESISVATAQIALLLWVIGIIAAIIGGLVGRIMIH